MYGSTAWLSHSAAPGLTSTMIRRSSGVALPASPRRKPPMLFTSTSGACLVGDPVDEGLGHSLIGRVAHLATDALGQLV